MLNKLAYTLMEDLFSLSKTDDLTSLVSRFLTMSGEDSSVVKEGVAGKGVETGKVRTRTENRIFTRQTFMYVCVSISYPPPPLTLS
jgi:hypothetical protein